MNWQEFEDNLKSRVDGHETPLDTDALWEKVQPRKRRRFLLWFWWLFGGIGLLGGIGWAVLKNRQSGAAEKSVASQEILHSTGIESAKQAETVPAQTATETKIPSLPDSGKTEAVRPDKTNAWYRRTRDLEKTRPQNAKGDPITPDNNNKSEQLHPVQLQTIDSTPVAPPAPTLKDTTFAEQDLSNTGNIVSVVVPASAAAKQSFQPLDIFPAPVARQDTQPRELPRFDVFAPLPFVANTVPRHRFQAGVYAGVSLWNVSHNGSGGSGIPRPNEHLLESVQAGVFGQLPMGRRIVFRAGVQYLQFNSVFRWDTAFVGANQEETVLNYYADGRVDTSYLSGALMQIDRKVKHYNKLIYINLPVDIQYRIPLGQGAITPFAGVQPGISIYRKGTILRLNGLPDAAPFQTIYRRTFALSVRAGVGFEWPWRKRVFFIEPTGTVDVIPRTAQGRAVTERFWQAGLNVGMRLR